MQTFIAIAVEGYVVYGQGDSEESARADYEANLAEFRAIFPGLPEGDLTGAYPHIIAHSRDALEWFAEENGAGGTI